jgi:preprotein translocase subunit SecG
MIFPDITLFFIAVVVLSLVIAVFIHRRKSRDR